MLANKLMSALYNSADELCVDDVFSTYLYTGNGSTQTINNGIDLAGKGGMVWIKRRNNTTSTSTSHVIWDTQRGVGSSASQGSTKALSSDTATAESLNGNSDWISQFRSNGFTVRGGATNNSGSTANSNNGSVAGLYTSWTFRRAPKFFDVVTYTGNGVAERQIPHSLGVAPGMVIVKRTDAAGYWTVTHKDAISLILNGTNARNTAGTYDNGYVGALTATTFVVHSYIADSGAVNATGATYVAYLFAHDTSADGIIQCGSYTGNGSVTGSNISLGWEPQYLMVKNTSGTGNWQIIDNMRGMPVGSADATLQTNMTSAEASADYISPTATGFQVTSTSSEVNTSGSNYIYLAIRRPNKPPTTGTQVYNAIARTGTGSAATVTGVGFAPDAVISESRNGGSFGGAFWDRLRGKNKGLAPYISNSEYSTTDALNSFDMNGISVGTDDSAWINASGTYINWFFRRAPGFFDVVAWTASGGRPRNVSHNLKVKPEFVIIKNRTGTSNANWYVSVTPGAGNDSYTGLLNFSYKLSLTSSSDTDTTFSDAHIVAPDKGIAYLFASLPGISKVGSYIGNGGSQTINCGFTTGARFALIKRTDSIGDWYVWDTARGIVSANDPHLSLNTVAAEVTTDDSVDPNTTGFIVNQVAATNINVNGATYIYLAFA